jgi:hypothetical protein
MPEFDFPPPELGDNNPGNDPQGNEPAEFQLCRFDGRIRPFPVLRPRQPFPRPGFNPAMLNPGVNPWIRNPGINPGMFNPGFNPGMFNPGFNPGMFNPAGPMFFPQAMGDQQAIAMLRQTQQMLGQILLNVTQLLDRIARRLEGAPAPAPPVPPDGPRRENLPDGSTREHYANGRLDRNREGWPTFAIVGDSMYTWVPGTLDQWQVVRRGSDTVARQRGSLRVVDGRLQFVRTDAPPPLVV